MRGPVETPAGPAGAGSGGVSPSPAASPASDSKKPLFADGNLLDFPASFIAHQCYCSSTVTDAGGLAYDLFQRYPHANVYVVTVPPFTALQRVDSAKPR